MAPEPKTSAGPAVREILAVAAGIVGCIAVVWLWRGELGMTWDEPYFFERQHDVRDWLLRVFGTSAERAIALSRAGLERSWRVCREVPDQHPPVPEVLSLVTGVVFEGLVGPLRAYRLSTVLVFAITAGFLFRFVRTHWGPVAALAALGGLLFNPRVLGDAQQITADVDLGAFWFLAAVAFVQSCETGRAPWRFGVLAGLAIMCKATGVLVLPAMVLWAILYRPRGAWRPIVWAVPVVPATMLALDPAWWPVPVGGMVRWARSFFSYPQKVPTCYLGRVYDSVTSFLPWHNTAVLTATMVPLGLLVLAALGLTAAVWEGASGWRSRTIEPDARLSKRAVAGWAAVNFLTLMGMRMLSFMPAHDGLRQLVPAFFFFAVLAGYGVEVLLRPKSLGWRRFATVAAMMGILTAGWEAVAIHPYELAYYNVLIGGPRGAKAAGMETTYFWDSATEDVLDWMNANLPRGATLLIFPPPNVRTFAWEQRWGRLRPDIVVHNMDGPQFQERLALMYDESKPCYMIFQMRQGLYLPRRPGDSLLFARLAEAPALYELAPARVGVRLLAIFNQAQFRAVAERGKR
ncbi:MAG: glycosyltransferase family 39 protein [Isosphaeraceae bacterium]|nr:glycosyltransferase family 39 protein [Isosphaeraceae bacterium]